MDYRFGTVALDRIDTTDRTYQITTCSDTAALAQSIHALGLLQPPMLMGRGADYAVICGFRRIDACRSLNLAEIPARLVSVDCPPITCTRMAIADNAMQRPLNVVEQSRAVALIRRLAGDAPDWLMIAASLGLPGSQSALERIMPVAAMPKALQDAVLDNRIALSIALQINQLEPEAAMALGNLLCQLNTGLNLQRELLVMISETALRDDIPIADLLARDEIVAITENPGLDPPRKTREMRQVLKSRRYPELSKAEAEFQRALKSLKLNSSIQLQPPPFFEGRTFRLILNIDSRRQLKALLAEVEKLAAHPLLLPE